VWKTAPESGKGDYVMRNSVIGFVMADIWQLRFAVSFFRSPHRLIAGLHKG
jgi:hypothetical protein